MTRAVRKLEVASSCAPSACLPQVEGENTRLRHYLARLHRKTLCYSKSVDMLQHSIRLLVHYLKFWEVPVPDHAVPASVRFVLSENGKPI